MNAPFFEKLKDSLKKLPYLPRALQMVWRSAAGWMLAWLFLLVLQGILPALSITLTRTLIDQLTVLIGAARSNPLGWEVFMPAIAPALGLAVVMLVQQILGGASNFVSQAQSERVNLYVSSLVHAKTASLNYDFYDESENYDRLHRAQYEGGYRPLAVVTSLGSLLQSGITLVSIAAILLPYGIWLPLVLLAASLPAMWVALRYQVRQHAWDNAHTEDQRRTYYQMMVLTMRDYAAELRLFGLSQHFQRAFEELRGRLVKERLDLQRKQLGTQLAMSLLGLLVAGGCMAWMIWRALHGEATLGDLALFYQAFSQGQSLLQGLLSNAGQLLGSLSYLGNLYEFLDMVSTMPAPAHPIQPSGSPVTLQFEGVSFAYPGSAGPVLQDFNLLIPGGKMTAILGDNGAGKSTLLKLICRLYDPLAGAIRWNGHDLRDFDPLTYWQQITVLFQEPVHYFESAFNNIHYGRHNSASPEEIRAAAVEAGADEFITALPQGYDTELGKVFKGGQELSAGQWQRIALARAFLRQAPLMLLDEPTSAMDAWAETEWLGRLRKLITGRTAVIITHRLTTAMQADLIYVMVAGKVVESGTHAELLALDGRYAEAWRAQTGGEVA